MISVISEEILLFAFSASRPQDRIRDAALSGNFSHGMFERIEENMFQIVKRADCGQWNARSQKLQQQFSSCNACVHMHARAIISYQNKEKNKRLFIVL